MKNGKIGVGSLCEIIGSSPAWQHFVGRECTVVGPWDGPPGKSDWRITIQGEGTNTYGVAEYHLKLKQEPPKESSSDEEAFRRFMDKTLMPLAAEQLEEV